MKSVARFDLFGRAGDRGTTKAPGDIGPKCETDHCLKNEVNP
jgi:hypothetical protein